MPKTLPGFLALFGVLVAVVGCSKSGAPAPDAVEGGSAATGLEAGVGEASVAAAGPSSSAPFARSSRKVGEECKEDWDCDRPLGCNVSCTTVYDDKNVKVGGSYCQLKTVADTAGAGPCVGNRSAAGGGSHPRAKNPRAILCNVDAGVYCDHASHLCAKAKAAGEACGLTNVTGWHDDDECSRDGACEKDKCVVAGGPGASCSKTRCKASARCDSKTKICIARKPTGTACQQSDECLAFTCMNGKCAEPEAKSSCSL